MYGRPVFFPHNTNTGKWENTLHICIHKYI